MCDIDKSTQEFVMIIASGILGYTRMLQHDMKATYIPPTKEQVIWQYQNTPLFNRTVDTIVSHLRHTVQRTVEADGICRLPCGCPVDGGCICVRLG